jgi:nucleoid-associated protein YgaU
MWSTKAFYWAAAISVAVVALASPILLGKIRNIWPSAQTAPSVSVRQGAEPPTGPPASPAVPTIAVGAVQATPPTPVAGTQSAAETAVASTTAAAQSEGQKSIEAASPLGLKIETPAPSPASVEPSLDRPAFDVVRVDPAGETVVAGHAASKAAVELRDDGRVIAKVDADESGQFVILPPPLAEGSHHLELAAHSNGANALVSNPMTVDVTRQKAPAAPATQAPTPVTTPLMPQSKVAAARPATQIDVAPTALAASATPSDSAAHVSVRTVEATEAGRLEVKGSAEANAIVRLYLNGSFLADALAGPDRQWSLTIQHGMAPGHYAIRADEVNRANGSVLARAEVPFAYPQHPSATGPSLAPAAAATEAVGPAPASTTDTASPHPTQVASVVTAGPAAAEPASQAPQPPIRPMAKPIESAPTIAAHQQAAQTPLPATLQEPAAQQTPIQVVPAFTAPPPATISNPPVQPTSPATPAVTVAVAKAPTEPTLAKTPTDVVVADIRTATVVRGDSLWRLSRRYYRDGMRYRQIYAANSSQIRNPSLIYPGQIFVVPKEPSPVQ